ncbi:oleosin-like [Cicer arietinum]|uniref:Major oleosin NAP-II-like n=1 Tax=Cicer arietinum TaxID=3827 RepID=A0A1S2XF30_CICAR|nr:major oleosin NAP-II-like [Cicer arietinum]
MADNYYPTQAQKPKPTTITIATSASSLLRNHVSNSTQLFGLLTLLITWAISLVLTGLTVIITIMGLIFFAPVIILLSPIWVPSFAILFVFTVGFLSTCGFGIVVVAILTWMFRYFRGLHPSAGHGLPSKLIDTAASV